MNRPPKPGLLSVEGVGRLIQYAGCLLAILLIGGGITIGIMAR